MNGGYLGISPHEGSGVLLGGMGDRPSSRRRKLAGTGSEAIEEHGKVSDVHLVAGRQPRRGGLREQSGVDRFSVVWIVPAPTALAHLLREPFLHHGDELVNCAIQVRDLGFDPGWIDAITGPVFINHKTSLLLCRVAA
jgi:hypothetical protein